MSKTIRVACHGPIADNPKNHSPWEDVALTWTGKPGRRKYHLVVTLFSKQEARCYHRELLGQAQGSSDTIHQSSLALEAIEQGRIGVIANGSDNLPDVYTSKEFIDRAEAERMIAAVMALRGFNCIKCKWKKPKFLVIPVPAKSS